MAVKLRFLRVGKKNFPLFRLVAIESRKARDGQYLENLGFYDPHVADEKRRFRFTKERVEYWLRVGAEPSETLLSFLKKEKVSGLIHPKRKKKRKKTRAAAPKTAGAPGAAGAAGAAATPGKPGRKPKPPKKPRAPKVAKAPEPPPAP